MKHPHSLLWAALLLSLLPCLPAYGQTKGASCSELSLASYNIRNAKGLDGRVSYDRWWRFVWKLLLIFLVLTAVFLALSAVL